MLWQNFRNDLAIGEILLVSHAVNDDHLVEPLVGFGVLDDAEERREPRAGAEQIEMLARRQIVEDERAGRLAAHHDGIALLQVLEAGCQGAVLDLDREELELFLVIGARDAVGPHERFAVDRNTDHRELAAAEPEGRIAGRAETEKTVGPVVDTEDAFFEKLAHDTFGRSADLSL